MSTQARMRPLLEVVSQQNLGGFPSGDIFRTCLSKSVQHHASSQAVMLVTPDRSSPLSQHFKPIGMLYSRLSYNHIAATPARVCVCILCLRRVSACKFVYSHAIFEHFPWVKHVQIEVNDIVQACTSLSALYLRHTMHICGHDDA